MKPLPLRFLAASAIIAAARALVRPRRALLWQRSAAASGANCTTLSQLQRRDRPQSRRPCVEGEDGCSKCKAGQGCDVCAERYTFDHLNVDGNVRCIKCGDQNCLDCTVLTDQCNLIPAFKCSRCQDGYGVTGFHEPFIHNVCSPCKTKGCAVCGRDYEQCDRCADGLGLQEQGACVKLAYSSGLRWAAPAWLTLAGLAFG